jgi:hypothetical protein
MRKFMLLHVGFEPPTPQIMAAWQDWFRSIADRQLGQGGFAGGRELSDEGTTELSRGPDCMTGYNIVEAEDLDEAERIAGECPWITAVRVYELRS